MRPSLRVVATALLLAAAMPAAADWSGDIEGGTIVRDGGNATRLRLSLHDDARPLSQSIHADWIRYESGSGYRLGYLPRFWLDEVLYLFGEAEFRADRPLGIERELLGIVGVGYRVFDTATAGFGVELGIGGRRTELDSDDVDDGGDLDDGADDAADPETEGLVLARAGLFRTFADTLRAELDVDVLQGERLGELSADAGVAYRVSGGAVRVGYRIRRLTPEDGPTLEDDGVTVSFTYGF